MDETAYKRAARVKRSMKPNRLMRKVANVPMVEPSFDPFSFAQRHIGPQADDVTRMLQVVGAPSLGALIDQALPGDIRQAQPLDLGPALSEPECWRKCARSPRATAR